MNNRLPLWFRQDIPDKEVLEMLRLFEKLGVNSVCKEAECPNITHCFKNKKAAFMILGKVCTRNCAFCAVNKSAGGELMLDENEPYRVIELVKALRLKYVVITSVTRDDLKDQGAGIFKKTIELIRAENKKIKIEVLLPDFQGEVSCLEIIIKAGPDIIGHNIETVNRLYGQVRPKADYKSSLALLKGVKDLNSATITKSSLMLGMGETKEEVFAAMVDLRSSGCDILTLGQYLAPSKTHYPVKEFIAIEKFGNYKDTALSLGFKYVLSGPKVRSSFHAEEVFDGINA